MVSAVATASVTVDDSKEIIHDKEALSIKHQVMDKMRKYSMFNSISDGLKFIAGPLAGIGTTALITSFTVAGASAALFPIGISMLIGATVALVGGVVAGFAASRMWQSGTFDNFELNAESTARHLVKELKTSHSVSHVEEHTQNVRADGKKWTQVVSKDPNAVTQPAQG